MKVVALKEGNFSANKEKEFVFLDESSKGIKMSIQPFLVMTGTENILLDAGLGWLENHQPKIVVNLSEHKLQPSHIDKILLSHLHKDHISGLVNTSAEEWNLNFPDAEIYIQKREYEFALSKKGSLSFDFEILDFIIKNAEIIWMNEDSGSISNEITFQVTGGHSPFHQVFWIKNEEEIYFYGADNLPQSAYLKYHLAYKTDFDGKTAKDHRIEWEILAKKEHWKVLLYHDLEQSILEF
ncbi:MBL fold metallo-hydrolase [Chryseobacterium caseinilyticum]|uniref:MBL fold metallo-hydrolase n=1 Tax=Chryseobacterium caseinilyticum TaxID=2771428 RepID=A0ABR8ZFY9_9FLAO|nr:MBL fold metallo-hydrolase [Chryseobacterium caseinilyticum]MBD8084204.1 MBL fold metallo-hydrolase [Chryseobacterium caseinilyticum]